MRKGYQGGYSNLSSSTLNRVLGISIEENCLFLSSVVALRRSDKLSMLERWEKPLVQISPLTTSRWISSCISCHYLWLQSFCKLNIGFKILKHGGHWDCIHFTTLSTTLALTTMPLSIFFT